MKKTKKNKKLLVDVKSYRGVQTNLIFQNPNNFLKMCILRSTSLNVINIEKCMEVHFTSYFVLLNLRFVELLLTFL